MMPWGQQQCSPEALEVKQTAAMEKVAEKVVYYAQLQFLNHLQSGAEAIAVIIRVQITEAKPILLRCL